MIPSRTLVLAVAALLAPAARLAAAEIEGALVVLEAPPRAPGADRTGAPPRFVLMKDGTVFVGGTSRVESGRLEKAELSALRKRIDVARKASRRGALAVAADEASAVRLRFPEDGPSEIVVDPRASAVVAPPPRGRGEDARRGDPVVALVRELLRFEHPSLERYSPVRYRLAAREEQLVGGCRRWSFSLPIEQVLAAPVTVAAADAIGWPTGALPASVCVGARRFVVTLRPLLPGEPLD